MSEDNKKEYEEKIMESKIRSTRRSRGRHPSIEMQKRRERLRAAWISSSGLEDNENLKKIYAESFVEDRIKKLSKKYGK